MLPQASESWLFAFIRRSAGRKMHLAFAILGVYVHAKPAFIFAHVKPGKVVHTRKEMSAEQLDQSLVRFTTPGEHAWAHAVATWELDGYTMSHVLGRKTEGAGNAIRT